VELPSEVHALISESISSVEMLEILLLLRRSPETFWGVPALSHQLELKEEIVRPALQRLVEARLVTAGQTVEAYRFGANEKTAGTVNALADAYSTQRLAVINTIYSENLRRLRAFSDAFRVRGQ